MSVIVASPDSIFQTNPYETHPSLSSTEADVLWEYAKLSQHLKIITADTRVLCEAPDKELLARLRVLETKMGLVLTLFKASVWGVINEQPATDSHRYADTTADTTPR